MQSWQLTSSNDNCQSVEQTPKRQIIGKKQRRTATFLRKAGNQSFETMMAFATQEKNLTDLIRTGCGVRPWPRGAGNRFELEA